MNSEETVQSLLASLETEAEKFCKEEAIDVHPVFIKQSLFDKYRQSKISNIISKLKHTPGIGTFLLFIKRKVLKWDVS